MEKSGRIGVVILAAGVGSRLAPITNSIPKALLPFAFGTLLEHQLRCLDRQGIPREDVTVLSGHLHEVLQAQAKDLECRVLLNDQYATANNVVSLQVYLEWREADEHGRAQHLVILNSDFLAPATVFDTFFEAVGTNAVLVDPRRATEEEAMKVEITDGWVGRFGKAIPVDKSAGEYMGLATFDSESVPRLKSCVSRLVTAGQTGEWYEEAFTLLSNELPIRPIRINDRPWIEIDSLEDYEEAKRLADQGVLS